MASNRADWRGGIKFANLCTVHVAAYGSLKPRRSMSFRALDPVHHCPLRRPYVDKDGKEVTMDKALKGVETKPDHFTPLSAEAIEVIENTGYKDVVEIERWSNLRTIPFDLTLDRYDFVPDDKVKGSEEAFNLFYAALKGSGRAAVIDGWSSKVGSRPSTLVLVHGEKSIIGYVIRFQNEVKHDAPDYTPEITERACALATQLVEREYKLDDYDNSYYVDRYYVSRMKAIEMAFETKPTRKKKTASPKKPEPTPDLLSALEATLQEHMEKAAA